MKKIIISILCLGMALSAYSQRTPSTETSSRQNSVNNSGNTAAPAPYHKVMFTYSPLSFRMTTLDSKKTDSYKGTDGLGITYMHGSPLGKFPLFMEVGGGVHFMSTNVADGQGYVVSLAVPVNLLYKFAFNGGDMHLAPFTGLCGRVNVRAKNMGDLGCDMRIFQLGWQIGAQFDIRKFYMHLAYATDITSFTPAASGCKSYFGGINIGLGVVF